MWVTGYIQTIYELLVTNEQYIGYKLNKNNIQATNYTLITMYELIVACTLKQSYQ